MMLQSFGGAQSSRRPGVATEISTAALPPAPGDVSVDVAQLLAIRSRPPQGLTQRGAVSCSETLTSALSTGFARAHSPRRVPDGRPINRSSPIEKGMKFVPVREQGSHEGIT